MWICGKKGRGKCSNDSTEDGSDWTPKDRDTRTEVKPCYAKRHEREKSSERGRTRSENENSMLRLQIGKRPKKKICSDLHAGFKYFLKPFYNCNKQQTNCNQNRDNTSQISAVNWTSL